MDNGRLLNDGVQIPVVGLAGYTGAGKTAIVRALVARYGCEVVAFSDTIKEAAILIWDLSEAQAYREREAVDERYGLTPRYILQKLGSEVGRAVWPDTWIECTRRRMEFLVDMEGASSILVDGVRFPNEVDAVHRWGGQVWRVDRPGTGPRVYLLPSILQVFQPLVDWLFRRKMHNTERCNELAVDLIVSNDGTLKELEETVTRLWDQR